MLHVLFLLLKILGILLLLLIGLFLLVLLTPIRYSFELKKEEQAELKFSVRITWLFWLFYFKTSYIEKVFDYRVRILGHQIAGNQKEFLEKQEERQKKKAAKEKAKEERTKKKESSKKKQEERTDQQKETDENLPIAVTEQKCSVPNALNKEPEEDILSESQKQSIDAVQGQESENVDCQERNSDTMEVVSELEDTGRKIVPKAKKDKQQKKASFLKKVENKFKKAGSRIKSLQETKDKLNELPWREWLELGKNVFFRFLKHVLPGKLEGSVTFGLNDPQYTGYITAIAATFYPKYGEHFSLYPNFEKKMFEAECRGRGRIRPGYMLVLVFSILKDKSVRTMIKNIILG